MKILWVFNHPAPYKVRLFNELSKYLKLDVVFERTKAKDRPIEFYNCNQYDFPVVFFKHGYFGNENSFSSELKKYIKKHHQEYDLIVMNGYSKVAEIKAIKYMNKHHIDFCLYINGGIIHNESKWKTNYKKKLISSAKFYFSPSIDADEYLINYGAGNKKIYHYPYSTINDVDILSKPLSDEEKALIREEYNLPNGDLFVNACQFIERKNNMQLIKLFEQNKKSLLLIGEGKEKEKYEEYIKEHNLNNIHLMSFKKKDELFKILRSCDYFITLSKEDIYGHTINEALANGLPVISSMNVIGSKRLIENGVNGYIVSLDDNEIQERINQINKNMSEAAIKTSRDYTIEASAKAHYEIIKEILKCE